MKINFNSLKFCAISLAILGSTELQAQNAQTSWVGRMGGAAAEMPGYNCVTTDNAGNVLLIGPYSNGLPAGTATFSNHNTSTFVDGGFSTASLPYTHTNNHFIYKSNAAGTIQWVKQIASNAAGVFTSVKLNAIKTDANGNIYITGSYSANVDFDPGPATVNPTVANSGSENMFVLKLNANGEYVWHREFRDAAGATTTGVGYGRALTISGANIHVAFQFSTNKSFYSPSSTSPVANSSITATGTGLNTGILKMDTAGNFVWVKQFSTIGNNASTPQAIETDASGNIYTAGYFYSDNNNAIDFDPSHTVPSGTSAFAASGSNDIFMVKLDPTGNYIWSKSIGSTNSDQCFSMAIGSNAIYIAGALGSGTTVDFNPGGTSPALLTNMGSSDAFVASYSFSGVYQWANKYGGTGSDQASGIVCLSNNELYVIGRVSRAGVPSDFDPQTPGNQGLTNFTTASTNNNTEAYLLKLTSSGGFSWVYTMGVSGDANTNDYGTAIAAFEGGGTRSVYSAGATGSMGATTVEANQAQFPINLTNLSTTPVIRIKGTGTAGASGGGMDIFLHKALEISCTPTTSSITATSCENYVYGSNTYTQSGIYNIYLTNSAGCDSIVTLNLTINPGYTQNLNLYACDSFSFAGQTYTQSGNYTHTFTSSHGCDSIVNFTLTVRNSTTNTITVTECESYTLGTQTYTQSGTYTQTLTNTQGCDSVITLNLTIAPLNVNVSQTANVLTAQASGVSYQWINCSNNEPIAGATQQTYTATANGNYAVIITRNNCSDTSECINVNTVSIGAGATESPVISVYPNPTDLYINIESAINGTATISSIEGRIIQAITIKKGISSVDVHNLSQGIYVIKVYDMNGVLKEVVKFSKQ